MTPGVYHYLIEIPGKTFETDLTIKEGSGASQHLDDGDCQVNLSLWGDRPRAVTPRPLSAGRRTEALLSCERIL